MKILRRQNKTLADLLPEDFWRELCAAGTPMLYGHDQLIEERGDTKRGISLVVAGEVAVGNIRRDGSFLVSGLLRKGECYGEFTAFLGLPQTHSLWSNAQTEIVFVGERELAALLQAQPILYEALLKLALWRNVEVLDFLDAQRRLSLPWRIAKLLLASPGKGPDQGEVDCRQEDLANTLGVSRVAVGKALKTLSSAGFISIGYGKITLLNRATMTKRVNDEQSAD